MADCVFFIGAGLCESTLPTVGPEQRVVAETGNACRTVDYLTFDNAFKKRRSIVASQQSYAATETGMPVGDADKLSEEFFVVCRIVAMNA